MPPKSNLKAPGSPTKKSIAKWNNAETKALILFLKSESDNMGTSSFKEASFTAAANHIKELHTDGPTKTALHCRNKWTSVGFLLSVITDCSNFFFIQLKSKFNTVERLASSSGAGASFDPRTGSNATTTSEQRVIDDFAARNSVIILSDIFIFF